jgi:ABC-type nitrate/sulfonate/bicarbonate transport system ATPase subunit
VAAVSALSVNIRRKQHGGRLVIAGLAFEVEEGELVCLLGPSGAGKTTALNIVAGLDPDFDGEVRLSAGARLSYIFQDPRLLPWRTLHENVALPLRDRPDAERAAAEWLDLVGLEGRHDLFPGQASLGMQRRAALARALAFKPTILLMDEPFVSLDERASAELRSLFLDLWRRRRVTTLFVTHNVAEAAELATRVLILGGSPSAIAADFRTRGDGRSDAEAVLRAALQNAAARSALTFGAASPTRSIGNDLGA